MDTAAQRRRQSNCASCCSHGFSSHNYACPCHTNCESACSYGYTDTNTGTVRPASRRKCFPLRFLHLVGRSPLLPASRHLCPLAYTGQCLAVDGPRLPIRLACLHLPGRRSYHQPATRSAGRIQSGTRGCCREDSQQRPCRRQQYELGCLSLSSHGC